MSRSGYEDGDGDDNNVLYLWPSIIERAIKGKRGQTFLAHLAREMDAMQFKRLVKDELITAQGECCTMGVVFKSRGISTEDIDPCDAGIICDKLGIAESMAREIAWINDANYSSRHEETPEERWVRMRAWVAAQLARDETKTK